MIDAPTPKYKIGDTVWSATTERQTDRLPCPDCKGEQVWNVRSPAGEAFTCACPRCCRTYSFRDDMPSLDVDRYEPKAIKHVITGVSVDTDRAGFGEAIEYRSRAASGGSYILYEGKVYDSEETALVVAKLMAAEKQTEYEAEPRALTSRHFSSLSMNEGKFDQHKNGLWSAHYHAGNLLERVKTALDGEDGSEERSPDQVIEDLRDATRWDFKYHIENMPLGRFSQPLV
jgi:uncharacterized protein YbaR (Trm112 family)